MPKLTTQPPIVGSHFEDLCTLVWQAEIKFFILPFIEKNSLLFAPSCLPVCKLKALGRGIAIRAGRAKKKSNFFIMGQISYLLVDFQATKTAKKYHWNWCNSNSLLLLTHYCFEYSCLLQIVCPHTKKLGRHSSWNSFSSHFLEGIGEFGWNNSFFNSLAL